MDAIVVALTDTKYKASFGENTMDAMVVDTSAALFPDFQRRAEKRSTIAQSWVVFGVSLLVYKICYPVELPVDEHRRNERPDESTVAFREFWVNGLRRPVHHGSTGLVWPLPLLNIVPVLYRPVALKPEDFKADLAVREIVLCMCKNEIAIFEGPHDIHSG